MRSITPRGRTLGPLLGWALVLGFALPLPAQPLSTLHLVPPAAPVSAPFEVGVELDHAMPFGLSGWSIAVCHDSTFIDVLSVEAGPTTLTANGGDPVDFVAIELVPGEGWVTGVVVDISGIDQLPPGTGYELYTARYYPTGLGATTPCFCDGIGSPPTNTWILSGDAYDYPNYDCPVITVDGLSPLVVFEGGESTATYDFYGGQGAFEHTLSIIEWPTALAPTAVTGFSMGLGYDAVFLEALSVEPAGPLLALNGGTGPEFFGVQLLPAGIAIDVDFSSVGETIVFSSSTEVAHIDFRTVPENLEGEIGLGELVLEWDRAIGGGNLVATATDDFPPGLEDGRVELLAELRSFVRGDCNGDGWIDIADLVRVAQGVLGLAPVECEEACRTNADGGFDIADAVYLGNYLFVQGPPPPGPFPGCGGVFGQDCAVAPDSCP